MTLKERARLIRSTKQMHSTWYRETYPDVASLGMDSAEHYLKYGAAMGRNPGKNFDTKFYLAKHPDLATLSITPLEHYATIGRARGSATSPSKPHAYVQKIRKKLFTLGFTEKPLAELQDIAFQEQDLCAAEEALFQLAMWHIRQKTPSDYETALDYIDRAFRLSPSSQRKSLLATCKLVTLYYCHRSEEAKHFYNSVALDAAVDANVLLAYSNHFESIHIKLSLINTALSQYDLPPLRLLPANGLSLYDRLTSAIPLQKITEGPKVTVLIAAYNCAETLPTALRSLSEQTWQNLEIIVIDDCSPYGIADQRGAFARKRLSSINTNSCPVNASRHRTAAESVTKGKNSSRHPICPYPSITFRIRKSSLQTQPLFALIRSYWQPTDTTTGRRLPHTAEFALRSALTVLPRKDFKR